MKLLTHQPYSLSFITIDGVKWVRADQVAAVVLDTQHRLATMQPKVEQAMEVVKRITSMPEYRAVKRRLDKEAEWRSRHG